MDQTKPSDPIRSDLEIAFGIIQKRKLAKIKENLLLAMFELQ